MKKMSVLVNLASDFVQGYRNQLHNFEGIS
jgi:hypothetical protein